MATYKHGVYVTEAETSLAAPISGTAGLQVVIGTAPINMLANPASAVNVPILVESFKEAAAAVGYSDDFANYTICESVSASFRVCGVGPMVLINVLDPTKHKTAVTSKSYQVNNGVAVVTEKGMLLSGLTVSNGSSNLVAGTDYTTSFNADGTLNIVVLASGVTTVTISGNKLDPSKVTAADIVGAVTESTGVETGLEVIRQIYPKFGLTAGLIIAPRWSHESTVAAAMQAKCEDINGVFKAECIIDVHADTYKGVKSAKATAGVSSAHAYAVWPYAKIGDVIYSGSAIAAALTAYTDADNDDTPNVSPSNKPIALSSACLPNGTEVLLDQDQANVVNSYGVATFLNMNGYRLWGNNTAAYPGTTDPKDRWFSVRRFLTWRGNSFILSYFDKVDSPANTRLIEAIVDSENILGNSFVARGICARYEIEFNASENTSADLLNGTITFHQYISPYTPAENIEDIIEFDPEALVAAVTA